MATAQSCESTTRATSLVALSALTLMAGVAGMAVSFLFLASRNPLDVIAGAAGFLAGSVLAGAGLLSLVVQCRSDSSSQEAVRVAGCLIGFLPPLTAILAWPVLYSAFFIGCILLMPFVLLGCFLWAWLASGSVAGHLSALLGLSHVGIVRGFVFSLQIAGILASWPLFLFLLDLLESMGLKVGWS